MSFPVINVMQLTHPNECATVTLHQPWKPPGGVHLVLPPGTKGMVLSHWPENGAIQRILFTVDNFLVISIKSKVIITFIAQV